MKTITTNTDVYEFSELSPEAQAKAIDDVRSDEYYLDYPWHEFLIEQFVEDITKEGWELTTKDVYFSGFWSQGDGASFDARLDVYDYINFHCLADKYPLILKLTEDGPYVWGATHTNSYSNHYSHERTRYFQIDGESEDAWVSDGGITEEQLPAVRAEMAALDADIEERRLELSQLLYGDLQKEYDELNSDEAIKDHIEANDYQFTINGKRYA